MKDTRTDKSNALENQVVKDLDAEIEDMIKVAEDESSVDPGDKYGIWRCNGLPVAVHFYNKRS